MLLVCFHQFQPERAALAQFGFQPDGAAHSFSAFFHDGKADAGAFVAFADALKNAEDCFVRVLFDAQPVVLEEESARFSAFAIFRPDLDVRDDARLART